jgi:hypothetical protein
MESHTGVLDLFHGHLRITLVAGARYFLLIVDDFSRKMWVYFLKKKSVGFSKFEVFKKIVEKESSGSVKALLTNNQGEFNANEFADFCKHEGI